MLPESRTQSSSDSVTDRHDDAPGSASSQSAEVAPSGRAPRSDGEQPVEASGEQADSGAGDSTSAAVRGPLAGGLLLLGVALAAANMRPAVTSLASVLGEVRMSLGASSTWTSVITSIPTLCFGLAGIGAPLLARRWGINRVLGFALAVLTAAMLLRVVDGPWMVLAGTIAVCAAIAMTNVLIPVVVKDSFPGRVGVATALYTTAMAAGGALGSTFTPWLLTSTGSWRLALVTWVVLAFAALIVWVTATSRIPAREIVRAERGSSRSLLRNRLAWIITTYFAMQSLIAYVVMGWLPEVLKGAGMGAGPAGALLGLLLVVGVPANMLLPQLVTRTRSQSGWAVGLSVLAAGGFLGLLLAPMAVPVLWVLLIGAGMSAFPLALIFISLRTRNAEETSELSAMAQSIGYLIACSGPFLFGQLHDLTGGWSASLVVILCVVVAQGCVGVFAGRPRTV